LLTSCGVDGIGAIRENCAIPADEGPGAMDDDETVLALGLMSGTSLDGIDAALVETDGTRIRATGAALTVPYADGLRERLRAILGAEAPNAEIAAVEREMTHAHADAVARLLAEAGRRPGDVAVIGFHGHTVLHRPEERRTWQLGDGALLAALTGIDVVCDFRANDVARGGQGAPLAPALHAALTGDGETPVVVLNLGGVGNVTWIGDDGALLAFDTGPGNALIDEWVQETVGVRYDESGRLAAEGRVDKAALAALLDDPYFDRTPPKSLDRLDFGREAVSGLSPADGAATLAAFTVGAVIRALTHLPTRPRCILVTGGGRHNATLMRGLAAAAGVPVEPVEAVGWDGDVLEAQAFAYLAVRTLRGLPLTWPGTTGVKSPATGGRLYRAAG
jgi:anhydro-N-acetylmuramic acid kinase